MHKHEFLLILMQMLLEAGAKPNLGDNWEGLHWAVKNQDLATVKLLIEYGINLDTTDTESCNHSPLTRATLTGNLEILQLLLAAGASVNKPGFLLKTALHVACEEGMLDAVKLLLHYGVDPTLEDEFRTTALETAARGKRDSLEMAELVWQASIPYWQDRQHKQYHINKGLCGAVLCGNTPLVKFFIKQGASVHCIGPQSRSLVNFTCCVGDYPDCIDELYKAGAELNMTDQHGQYPLHFAVEYNRPKSVDILLRLGANPNIHRSSILETPLLMALNKQHDEIAIQLIQGNCDVNQACYTRSHAFYTQWNCIWPVDVVLQKQRMSVLQPLILAGCQMYPLKKWILRNALEQGSASIKPDLLNFVRHLCKQPLSLKQISRIAIRRTLHLPAQSSVEELPLPSLLKDFIMMKELKIEESPE